MRRNPELCRSTVLAVSMAFAASAITGCDRDDSADAVEEAGEQVEETLDEVGDEVEETADEAAEKIEEGVEESGVTEEGGR